MNIKYCIKTQWLIAFSIFVIMMNNSLGFDLYSHVTAYTNYQELQDTYKNYYLLDTFLPRYLLLSLIYESSGVLLIPIGYVILFLNVYPVFVLFGKKSKIYSLPIRNGVFRVLFQLSFTLLVSILVFFYSALSLTIIWSLAYLFTQKKIFSIAVLFHPLGLIIFTLTNGLRKSVYFSAIWVVFFLVCFLLQFDNHSIFYSLRLSEKTVDLSIIKLDIILTKSKELSIALFVFLILFFKKKKKKKKSSNQKGIGNYQELGSLSNYALMNKRIMFVFISFSLFSSLIMIGKKTPLYVILNSSSNVVISAAWGFQGATSFREFRKDRYH